MALSVEQQAWLEQLRAARKQLILGERIASVASGGRSLSLAQLPAEQALKKIEDEIALLEAADAGDGKIRTRGAIRFTT